MKDLIDTVVPFSGKITKKLKKELGEKISSFSPEEQKNILILIVQYAKKEDNFKITQRKINLPYKGDGNEKSCKFNIDDLSEGLIRILHSVSNEK